MASVISGGEVLSDEALAAAVQQGDKNALSVLIEKYRPFAAKAAAHFTGVSMETDDFIQEAMLALLSAAYTFSPFKNTSFRTYAGVCVQNRLRSVIKAEAAGKNQPLNSYIPLDEIDISGGADPESQLISAEETEALFRLFDRDLSSLEKQVLIAKIEGLSYSEISTKLHITEKSTDNALQRVRIKLKRILDS